MKKTVFLQKIFLSAVLAFFAASGMAQGVAFYKDDSKSPVYKHVFPVDSVPVDTSYLAVSYYSTVRLHENARTIWHITRLEVGRHHSLFYDFSGHNLNKIAYNHNQTGDSLFHNGAFEALEEFQENAMEEYEKLEERWGDSGSYFYRSVLSDYSTGKFKVVVPDIWAPGQYKGQRNHTLAHIYEERVPVLEWELTDECDTVATYVCRKAVCEFRGRRWEVWYTTDIPVGEGPWKLKGLPGLILKARDTTGQYTFEASSLSTEPAPIYDYIYEHEKKTTYRRFKRHEKHCYLSPKSFNEGKIVYIETDRGTEVADHWNWRLEYQPMER